MKAPTVYHKYDENEPKKKYYYVSCVDAGRCGIVAGPWDTYQQAQEKKRAVKAEAEKRNPYSYFYAWGVCGSDVRLKSVFEKHGIVV